ncbi:DNA replication/repair protein RecF [Alphaproteobacteria bacterium]|nr:DNA replication/repair protein RecF [Alphaproteobacteria bacterium]
MSEFQGINSKKTEIKNKKCSSANTHILSLKLSNFRNHQSYKVDFPNCPIAFIGKNGVGKTNILEAISLMQPGRGLRSVSLDNIAYKNCGNFAIHINLIKNMEKYGIGSSLDLNYSKSRKVKIDGKFISPLGLTNYLGIISITPLMDKIFIEGSSNRRKFIDKITWIFYSSHAKNIRSYEKLIRERNSLFKDNIIDRNWFETIEKQIVEYGSKIIVDRLKVIKLLNNEINNNNFPKADMVLKGELECKFNSLADLDSFKEYFLKTLFDTRSKDAFRCVTSIGPHRSELEVSYKEKAILASLCSTGEQKSLLISIILAVAKSYKNYCNLSPILLLDEVFAHLDSSKKESLSKEIKSLNVQAFMTGTEESDFMTFNKNSYIINLDNIGDRRVHE